MNPADKNSSAIDAGPEQPLRPVVVLAIGGHDPVGGAGLQADIETITALGAHAVTLATCLTTQNSHAVQSVLPTDPTAFRAQWCCLMQDVKPDAIKIGALGSSAIANQVADLIDESAHGIPLVIDPVWRAGGGGELADRGVVGVLLERLLPMATVATPNADEMRQLAESDGALTCPTLLTGGDSHLEAGSDPVVVNRLYELGNETGSWQWPRLAGEFHGSGCTLSSALATRLAQGAGLHDACRDAQAFTHTALVDARAIGSGQRIPWRRPETRR